MNSSNFTRLFKFGTITLLVIVVLAGATFVPTRAQTPPATQPAMPPLPGDQVIGDLGSPRGISFDEAGNLLVAVAGTGGDAELSAPSTENPKEMMTIRSGLSGKVLSIGKDGKATPLLQGLPSYATPSETIGVYRVYAKGSSIWLVMNGSGPGAFWSDAVVELDAKTLNPKRVINLAAYEATNNPDGNEIDSNAADIAWTADGTLLIADAGANTVYSWTEKDGLAVVATWKDNSVPDSLEVAANGDLYVGFLGTGLAPQAARIERWSGGKLAETFKGLNAVTDIMLDGTNLYAVELVLFSDKGPGPGRVVKVDSKGSTPVAEGLPAPFALAKGPDGALYVSFGSVAFAPGMTGGVLKLKQN